MGGFGYGSSNQSSKPDAVNVWTPEQNALFQQLAGVLQGGAAGSVPSYPGQMYVGQTQQDQQYLNWVKDNAAARGAAVGQINSGRVPYEIGPEWANKYYSESIKPLAIKEYNEITKPGINEAFAGNYYSSGRRNAQARASGDLATNLAAQRAGLMYGEEQASRAAQEAALGRQAMYGPAAAQGEAAILGTAGAYARQIEQEKMLSDVQRWLMGETVNGVTPTQYNPYLQLIFQALGLTPNAVGQNTTGHSMGWNFSILAPPASNTAGGTPATAAKP